MGKEISTEQLKEAKEKLACHIEPPHKADAAADLSCSVSDRPVSGEVRLTQMTTAGG